jgi:TonB family protein
VFENFSSGGRTSVASSSSPRFGPRPGPFVSSLLMHSALLAFVAIVPRSGAPEKSKSAYRQMIAPNERKLVWYTFAKKLPEVSPLERIGRSQPPRIEQKIDNQTIVSKPLQAPKANQLVWNPVPELKLEQDLKSPNLMAFHAPKTPPPPPRRQPKLFSPPPEPARRVEPAPDIPAAPKMEAAVNARTEMAALNSKLPPRPEPKKFAPPVQLPPRTVETPALPIAPAVAASNLATRDDVTAALAPKLASKPQPKGFTAPAQVARRMEPAPALPSMPNILTTRTATDGVDSVAARLGTQLPSKPEPRKFVAPGPPGPAGGPVPGSNNNLEAPPQIENTNLSAAVVGLNPVPRLDAPIPDGAREAQFSAGPQKRAVGGNGEPIDGARIFVPDLMISGGAKDAKPTVVARAITPSPTSQANLSAAAHMLTAPSAPTPAATRVAATPIQWFEGRFVYTLAIQMPNVTSYSGSWIMWFAEHRQLPGEAPAIRAPVPLRKVDPKYLPSAIADRVEGKVQLAAVIRKDGRVDAVTLVKKLDDRLDQSAVEALQKWEFEPAMRNGAAVDVDAVVEIPFRLAPRAAR